MPQSLACLIVHAVFSTKNRVPFLSESEIRKEVHAYMGGISKRLECPPIAVGGVADHVHAPFYLNRTVSVAEWIKEVKRVSSHYAKERLEGFSWQSGYAAFSVDPTNLDRVAHYVRNQEAHHHKVSFQEEFRKLLAEHGVVWDERYVWD